MLSRRERQILVEEDPIFLVALEDQVASTPQNLVEAVSLLEKKEHLLRRLKWQS